MKWIWQIAVSKLIKRFVQIVVAWVIGHNLERFGVTLDPLQLSASIWAALEFLRGWLKSRWGLKFL